LLATSLAGCNQVMGIERPSDLVIDEPDNAIVEDASVDQESAPATASSRRDADVGDAEVVGEDLEPVPHAWAEWPMPNPDDKQAPNPQSYTGGGKALVVDVVTQLTWEKTADDGSYTWAEAEEHCAALTLEGGGFRLPTRIELVSLVDYTVNRPTIDAKAFPDTPAEKFWSASPFAGAADSAWLVNFDFGTGFVFAGALDEKHRVRCVR
jgi:hypothetical protein